MSAADGLPDSSLPRAAEDLAAEIRILQARLVEAEETLRAIREGEVDALVVSERRGEKIYTLKSADRTFRLMVEGMRQGALSLTSDGRILYSNSGFARILGFPPERAVGGELAELAAPESRPQLAALLRRGWGEGSSQGEVLLLGADGTQIPTLLAFSAIALEEGVYTLLLVVTDLSEQKQLAELHTANTAKDQFLATLSHELRTPLTPVMAVVSSLERDERLPADLRGSIAMVRRNVELEARLIDDLLDLTRIARGKLEIDRRATDLREILEQTIETCCAQDLAAGRLRVVRDLEAVDHRVWADPPRLAQVFWNLLSNSVKFTPAGGTIAIRSWTEVSPGAEPVLAVEVSDTGIGIRSDLLPKIFSAFDQGDQGTLRRFGGLGLGLTISRAIVDRHGGRLDAASEGSGQGAVFTVRLPVCPELESGEEAGTAYREAQPGAAAEERPLHILLVEDHADTAEAMSALLGALGHRVTRANSVARALEAAAEAEAVDLVVSDLGLPDGSGHDLMRALSALGLRGIALSGYGMEDDIRKSHEAGFEKHLTKPIDAEVFKAAIRQVVRVGR